MIELSIDSNSKKVGPGLKARSTRKICRDRSRQGGPTQVSNNNSRTKSPKLTITLEVIHQAPRQRPAPWITITASKTPSTNVRWTTNRPLSKKITLCISRHLTICRGRHCSNRVFPKRLQVQPKFTKSLCLAQIATLGLPRNSKRWGIQQRATYTTSRSQRWAWDNSSHWATNL